MYASVVRGLDWTVDGSKVITHAAILMIRIIATYSEASM